MGYSSDDSKVRVDFFKEGGKWYTTEEVKWTGGYANCDIHTAFKKSIRDAVGDGLSGMIAVCLEPYHEYAHPLMTRDW